MTQRRKIDQPPARANKCRDPVDQDKVAQVIGAELRFEAVRRVAERCGHHSRIGDDNIEGQLAMELEQHLTAIRQEIRRPVEAEFAKGGLTGPQRNVMQALVRSGGSSLKEFKTQVGLAHSTVSGIVDRLAKRGLVERQPNLDDRRHTRITVSHEVREFLAKKYRVIAALPLFDVLRQAEATERNAIVTGIRSLRRLLDKRH